ncbi:hypothetical protein F443_17702 [Phytophthora nicotianae P1569]|uniref:Uncharacterized protein n=1 Tax=Phytophthora nicotianae P1569 TaxID=1317065 RepID=V9EAV1_PHYNI|nr:hypothetical protein F443_17702 [Phytophthora nicotianae P1569]
MHRPLSEMPSSCAIHGAATVATSARCSFWLLLGVLGTTLTRANGLMASWVFGHLWRWWSLNARPRAVPPVHLSLSASRSPRRLTKHFSSRRSLLQLRPSDQDLKRSRYSKITQRRTRVHNLKQ